MFQVLKLSKQINSSKNICLRFGSLTFAFCLQSLWAHFSQGEQGKWLSISAGILLHVEIQEGPTQGSRVAPAHIPIADLVIKILI